MLLKEAKLLIIDDDPGVLMALRLLLKPLVQNIECERQPDKINSLLIKEKYDLIVLDMNFRAPINTGNEGLFWLKRVKELDKEVPVILITAYGEIELAIRALKEGAADFIVKPWQNEKVIDAVKDLFKSKSSFFNSTAGWNSEDIIGESDEIKTIFSTVQKIAPTDANVLLLGENGTGKDLFARAIHQNSHRKDKPFIRVDVGALTESLFESELFGYKKGAFTDAREDRKGRFEAANGGTLFLDEIGNISLSQQARLLTVLQTRQVTPLGSSEVVPIDIRLISATNLQLHHLSEESRFRKDLIYRINTVDLTIPPLRARGSDIPLLARYFLDKYSQKYQKEGLELDKTFVQELKKHSFPGNVRELQFVMERSVIMADNKVLTPKDLSFSAIENPLSTKGQSEEVTLEAVEKNTILKVIDRNKGNISKSARELGITRAALYRRLEKYGL